MMLRSRRVLSSALALSISLLVVACTDNGRDPVLSDIETVPPAPQGPQGNQNIPNPTLTIAENSAVAPGGALTLVWSDEFDGATIDPETWFFATGDGSEVGLPGGWGNAELQWYLPDNAQVENGVLKITARLESIEGRNHTSARINTEDRFAFKYGRIEASIKLPSGQGLWPAFWMLPQDSPYGEWAAKGEIDIVEAVNLDGTNGNEIFATIHYGGEFPANQSSSVTYVPGPDVTEDFHTYAIEWDEFEIRWYFDGELYAVQNNWFSTAAPYPAPFDQPFHILLNLAVGGNFPGFAIDNSVFPATMEVDWVRVYSGEEDPVDPADPGVTPEFVLFGTSAAADVPIPDFVQDVSGPQNFGSGATFDFAFADSSFDPVIAVTAGDGYGADTWVAFLAVVGYANPIAVGYDTFNVKVKGSPLGNIEVKLIGGGDDSVFTADLATYAGSTDLGDGWYQLEIPFTDFSNPQNIPNHTGWLVGPPGDQADAAFVFLLTDVGFSNVGGGGAPGVTPEFVLFGTTEPADVAIPDFVQDVSGPQNFGSGATFDFEFADTTFDPVIAVTAGEGYGAGVWVAFIAVNGYANPIAVGYDTFNVKVKDSPLGNVEVKLIGGGDDSVFTADLATYAGSTDIGDGWYQLEIPFTDFSNAQNIPNHTGWLVGPPGDQADAAFVFLLTDVGFSNVGGGGGGGDGSFVNGDFEAGFEGWTQTLVPDNTGSIALDNSGQGGRAGTVARLTASGSDVDGGNDVLLSQVALAAGVVAPGDSIDVSFDLYGALTGAGGVVFVEVIFLDANGQDVGGRDFVGPAAPYVPTTTWTPYSGTVVAGTATGGGQFDVSGGVTLQLKAACGAVAGGCGVDASFDNVTFTIN